MTNVEHRLERTLMAAISRLSDRAVVLLAFLTYAGAGLALPLALQWPTVGLVSANFVATSIAGLILLLWLAAQVNASHRRHLMEWTTNLRLLTSQEFEWLVGELFRREGWQVKETGRQDGPDGNVDLELRRDGRRMIVQCKRWGSWQVSVDEIRKFAGTLMREGLAGASGVFVTLSDFSEHARAEAAKVGFTLMDRHDLYQRVEKVRRPEPCPTCGASMILGRSQHGWWFRCTAKGCQGKRDLGSEPGRAVELLLTTT